MEDDNKKVEDQTTEAAASAEETKSNDTSTNDQDADVVDYKAELDRAKRRIEQAEHTIVDLKKKAKNSDDDSDEDDDTGDTPDISSQLEKIKAENRKELEKIKLDLVKDSIDNVISSLSSNPDEQALIKFNYENRIVRSGFDRESIKRDLIAAQLLANQAKLETKIKEMRYTLNSEAGKNKSGSATGQNVDMETRELTDKEEAWVKTHAARTGIAEDKIRAKLIENNKKTA